MPYFIRWFDDGDYDDNDDAGDDNDHTTPFNADLILE